METAQVLSTVITFQPQPQPKREKMTPEQARAAATSSMTEENPEIGPMLDLFCQGLSTSTVASRLGVKLKKVTAVRKNFKNKVWEFMGV